MATIGTVILKLEAQHAELKRNLEDSRQEMKRTADAGESMGSTLKGIFAGIVIGAGIGMLKSWTMETIESATAAYRLSGSLGITTASLKELQTAGLLQAGLQADEFNGVLQHMVKNLGEAGEGAGPALDALKNLGITAKDLKGLHTDETFKLIAQRISEIKDPTEQARAATELFGKQGQQLLPLFQSGAEGIEEAAAKARKFGVAMSDLDAAKLVQANEKFEEISLAAEGFKNKLVVAIAPALSSLTQKILDIVPATQTVSAGITSGMKGVATGIAYVIDAWKVLKAGVLGLGYLWIAGLEGVMFVLKKLSDTVVWVSNKLFKTHIQTPTFITESVKALDDMRKSMGEQIGEVWNQPSAVSKVDAFFENINKKAEDTAKAMADKKHDMAAPIAEGFGDAKKKIDEILKGMADDVKNFGLTESQKKVNELKSLNATPQQLAQAQASSDRLKQLEDWKKDQEEAKKIMEEAATPLEKYGEQLKKLDKLRSEGMLNNKAYAESVAKANEELSKSFKDLNQEKKVGAETRRFNFDGPTKAPPMENPLKQLVRTAEMQGRDVAQSKFYLQQLYQFQLNPTAQPDSDIVVDWTGQN